MGLKKCDGDFGLLHKQYFPHRSTVALKAKYRKVSQGLDTPATTPRLSLSHLSTSLGNSAIKAAKTTVKLLTPQQSPMKSAHEEEEEGEEEQEEDGIEEEELEEQQDAEEEEEKMIEKEEEQQDITTAKTE